MPKIKGRTFIVEIEDSPGSGNYISLCGLTAKTFTVNNEPVDVTTPDCTDPGSPLIREILEGVQTLDLSGDGLVEDSNGETVFRQTAFGASPYCNFRLTLPGVAQWTGQFFIASCEYRGEMVGGVGYSFSLNNKGAIAMAEL